MKKSTQTFKVWCFQKSQLKIPLLLILLCLSSISFAQVDTGGKARTSDHQKQIIGYVSNWDAWKNSKAGVPSAGALTHLNIDYSKYTILNYSFFGVARDGSLHSGDHRNKKIHQEGVTQEPADLFYTDLYSSWDLHLLFGELEYVNYINEDIKKRAEAQGFVVDFEGTTWEHPVWGLSGGLPLPLKKEGGAPGIIELARQKGVKLMASLGGWSMCKHFPEMAADPVKRAKFIADCKRLIAIGFDGIDFDWEYPGPYSGMNFTGTEADFGNFENLIKELRNEIGSDKLITAAMSADPRKLGGFNWSNLVSNMDYFNMMTYDFNGGWSNKANHNAPLYTHTGAEVPFFNWQSTLDKLIELGVPKNKICFGAPFYGRGVITKGEADLNGETVKRAETVEPDGPIQTAADYDNWPKEVYDGTPNYFFIKQKALSPNSGWTRKWDDEAKVPYLVKGKYFLSYDDEESIGIKAQFIKDNDLGGAIIWTAYGDLEFGGSVTSFGRKLKRWSDVKSPLVNKINEVFADGTPRNILPKVSITSPVEGATYEAGASVTITAVASDEDGTITKVEFYNGTTKLGEDTTAPYEYVWAGVEAGTYKLTAKATDNKGGTKRSSPAVSITVNKNDNILPKVSITSPVDGATFETGASVAITANASDEDGTVAKVEFYNGTTKLGEDTTAPYEYSWANVAAGTYVLTAKATDDKDGMTTSTEVSITVGNDVNVLPRVSITSPVDGATYKAGASVSITAEASDKDGTVTTVEFYNGTTKLGEDTTAPYEYVWADVAAGTYTLTAKATDDKGGMTTSSEISIVVTKVVGNKCDAYPEWSATAVYTGGKDVKYNNVHYRAKWWTQNQNPEKGGVWEKIGPCGDDTGNVAPVISLTLPKNGATYEAGASVTIAADASDKDGTVSKVEFYNGTTKLGEDATAPYEYVWENAAIGNYSITAKATDDGNKTATSAVVSIIVKVKDGGGNGSDCAGLSQYSAGTSYGQDEEVQNDGYKFKCNIPGWCSSASAWAYAPGTGLHWQDAWTKTGKCGAGDAPVVTITSPVNGSTYEKGSAIVVNANVTAKGVVSKVEFYNGTTKLGEDTTSPYSYTITNAQSTSYSLTATATDTDGKKGTSEAVDIREKVIVTPSDLPSKILVGYWHNFDNGSTTPRLSEVSTDWDVVCVAFAEPKSGSTADMQFSPFEIYNGDTQAFINDVATVRSRGKKVLISIGGANARVELNNEVEKNEFVSSMINIINTYGFDGLDIDLEGSSLSLNNGDTDFRNPTTPKIKYLIEATKEIRANIGASKFILSMAPETAYVQGGYGNYTGVYGAYLPLIDALRSEMNYIHVQHYNTGSMAGRDGKVYQPATADFHVAMAEMLITGFPVAQTGLTFSGLRADQVAIGLPSTTNAAGSGYTSEAVVQQALDYLIKGTSYPNRKYTTASTYPTFRGLMTWSINWDLHNNSSFSSSHRAYLDGLSSRNGLASKSSDIGKVFPNPVSGNSISITMDPAVAKSGRATTTFSLQIFNTSGLEVLSFENNRLNAGEDTKRFDIGNLESGMYFYTISANKNKTTGKFIKR